ncbi:hypothetical protein LAH08_04225 [Micromonospora noduli]|uniref:Uncharacterized protein n=1 Tax=Micromonospora noduli TaxID=709876 RepID=A0A328N6Q5_9ACTN|nr:hypothetical protein LAH08_04225 [Micromonospora noduli]
MDDLVDKVDLTLPWSTLNEQFRRAYWRACGPVRPRKVCESVVPAAAMVVYRRWTAAFYAHPGSPLNRRPA